MSAVNYIKWTASVFIPGLIWYFLNPVVGQVLLDAPSYGFHLLNVAWQFLRWAWLFGVPIMVLVLPTVWLWRQDQKRSFRGR